MGKANVAFALAVAVLFGTAMTSPAVRACGKMCALGPTTPADTNKKVKGDLASQKSAKGGNIGDYWSPCNSNKLTDYMYCQP
mgnify:CR=1 FL=1